MSVVFVNNSVVIQIPPEQRCVHPGQIVTVLSGKRDAEQNVHRRAAPVYMDYVM